METKKFLDGEGLKTLWDEITALQSDYNETDETSPNYIKNKPFTIDVIPEEVIEEFTFTTSDTIDESTGLPTMQYVQLFSDLTIGQKMNLQFTYPELAAATGQPQYDDNENIITKTVRYENVEVGNFADAMGSQFLDSPAIMMGPGALIATLPESIQRVAIPNDDIIFVYSNATLANGTKVPLLITALMDQSAEGYSTYVATCHTSSFITEEINLVANRENHIALQSDWDEQNKENSAYIQNKPFGDEIILTPKNEFYRDSFIEWYGDDKSGFGNPGYSLQVETGKQYILQAFGNDGESERIVLTCVDHTFEGIDLPEGAYLLGDFNNQGQLNSLTFLVDKAKFDSTQENMVYDENSCLIVFTDELYKIIIHDTPLEGTYERTIINKIDKKYLPKADQSYNWTSENPQSGIAVNEAILQFKNKLPNSVVTGVQTLSTLGDQHVKVQYGSTNTNTYPYQNTYNIYTEGIGLNSDLQTNTRGTLVAAINELKNRADDIKTVVWQHYDLIAGNQDNIKKNTMTINDVESHKQSLCWGFPTIETNSFNEYKNSNIITNNLEKENIDIFIDSPYQYTIPLDYKIIDPCCLCIIDPQNKVIRQITEKGIEKNYYLPETAQEYLDSHTIKFVNGWSYRHTTTTTGWLGNNTYNSGYSGIYINILDYQGKNLLQLKKLVDSDSFNASVTTLETTISGSYYPSGKIASSYNYTVSNTSGSELGQSWTKIVKANGFTGKGFLPTDKENPGLLQWIGPDKKLYSFGQDDWTNAQVYGSFQRALNAEGIEVLGNSSNTGIDNNQHSVYCQDPNSLSYVYCITSAGEVLRRSASTGSINKRWTITTDSDLFTENLQYLRTYFINNNIYAIRDKNLYVIDISTSGSAAAKLISDNFGTNDTYASLFVTNDNIIKFNSLYKVSFKEIDIATLRKVNSFSTPTQSDYNQNDDTQLDYIKNRPVYEKYTDVDYTRLSSMTDNPNYPIVLHSNKQYSRRSGGKIGLVEGQEYEIDWYEVSLDASTGEIIRTFIDTYTVTATKADTALPSMYGDFTSIPASIIRLYDEDIGIEIYDGCTFQNTTITALRVNAKASVYFTGDLLTDGYSYEYVIKNIPSQDYEIKKLGKNFVGADIDYNKLSLNPQSGIAVEQAIIAHAPQAPITLGDEHIKVLIDNNNVPQLYTEGIGHNEDLKTVNQETIVDAINEVANITSNQNNKHFLIKGENLLSLTTLEGDKILSKVNNSNDIFPLTAEFDYEVQSSDVDYYDNKCVFVVPVYDGFVELAINSTTNLENSCFQIYHIDKNNNRNQLKYHYYKENDASTWQFYKDFNTATKKYFIALQNLETKEYVFNLFMSDEKYEGFRAQYNLNNMQSRAYDYYLGMIQNIPTIDSSGIWYSEQRITEAGNGHFPLTVDADNFIIPEEKNLMLGTSNSSSWDEVSNGGYGGGYLTEFSSNGKIYYIAGKKGILDLIDKDGNVIVPSCLSTSIERYNNYIAILKNKNNVSYLQLIDIETGNLMPLIPLSIYAAYDKFVIIDNYIYLFNGKNCYAGEITFGEINIIKTEHTLTYGMTKRTFMKCLEECILVFEKKAQSLDLYYLSRKKELKFNEADVPSIETINTEVIKNYKDSPILINNISPIEHDIKIKVTGKNLFDISKITAKPDSTSKNYISEVGDNYIIINTLEDYSGNGATSIGLKLKELCPQLEVGKNYTFNAESPARNQIIHCGAPATYSWTFGKNITMTEDLLNSPIYFYGLSTQDEQGTGECKISNIQIYEADNADIVLEYAPYVDVTSLNLNVQGKNLLDINLAMLNYDISHGSAVGTEFNSSTAIRANNGYIVFDKMNIKGGQTYTISLNNEDLWLDRMFQLDENSLITKHHSMYGSNIDQAVTTITIENNTTSLVIRLRKKDGSIATIEDLQKAQLQIELNDAQTDYEPYFNETYSPDSYGNISVSYIPYICYLDINSDKVNMFVSYNKKLDGIYYDIQKLQSRNNQLQQKVETLEQIIQTNEERITLLENTVSNLVSVLSNQ